MQALRPVAERQFDSADRKLLAAAAAAFGRRLAVLLPFPGEEQGFGPKQETLQVDPTNCELELDAASAFTSVAVPFVEAEMVAELQSTEAICTRSPTSIQSEPVSRRSIDSDSAPVDELTRVGNTSEEGEDASFDTDAVSDTSTLTPEQSMADDVKEILGNEEVAAHEQSNADDDATVGEGNDTPDRAVGFLSTSTAWAGLGSASRLETVLEEDDEDEVYSACKNHTESNAAATEVAGAGLKEKKTGGNGLVQVACSGAESGEDFPIVQEAVSSADMDGADSWGDPPENLPEVDELFPVERRAEVLFHYSPHEKDELDVRPGQPLRLLGLAQPGWYLADVGVAASSTSRSGRRVGLVPSNFVRLQS